jgi:hypothetical protein
MRSERMMPKLLVSALIFVMIIAFPITPVASSSTTYVKVINPATGDGNFIFDETTPLGHEFIANITVVDVGLEDPGVYDDLATWQLNLTFNKDIINVKDIFTPADHVFAGRPTTVFPKNINNALGYVVWGITVGPPAPPDPPSIPFNGTGTLCQIRFNVTKTPGPGETLSCNITIDRESGFLTTFLLDPDIEDLPFTEVNGYYEISAPAPPPPPTENASIAVEPPTIIDPAMVPPTTFQINITIANVTDLYGYEFSLSFNPTILCCIGLTIRDPLNETHYTPEFAVNNTAGLVWVKVSYYPPAVPITTNVSETLVTLIFRVIGFGATPLDLHDTSLIDSFGRPIPHEVRDGFFANLIRDLAVVNVTPLVSWAYKGTIVKVNVTVRNEGDITETFDVKAYYDNNTIGTITVTNLNPDQEITITFSWNTQDVTPCHNYTISAEAVPVPWELDLEDNYLSDGKVKIRILGDVNGDGRVDGKDIALIIKAFGSYPGHPRWNPEVDVNGDDRIDAKDIAWTIKNYGKTCI